MLVLLVCLDSTEISYSSVLSGIMKNASTGISYLKILSGVFHYALTKISYMQILLGIFVSNKKLDSFIVGGEFHRIKQNKLFIGIQWFQ